MSTETGPDARIGAGELRLDGGGLSLDDLANVARSNSAIKIDPRAMANVSASHALAKELSAARPIYGITTGVGANKLFEAEESVEHGLRLLRSQATCFGPIEKEEVARGTMMVRLNQLLNAGSSASPEVVAALADALNAGALPTVHRYGTVGTADLAALSEIALTLAGELPWSVGDLAPVRFEPTDALAFMSSSALTATVAGLTCVDLGVLTNASCVVAALSFAALKGSAEAYSEEVYRSRPLTGATKIAATMRRLVLDGADNPEARRIQDPFGLRTLPQVHGAALDALRSLEMAVNRDINAKAENPMVSTEQRTIFHHGQFYAATTAAALDAVRGTVYPVLALSVARLTALQEPNLTGLNPFLADGPAGSSGTMGLEYIAHDVLAECRRDATPVSLAGAVLSRGMEEQASFSAQAARATKRMCERASAVMATEMVCAVRALRAAPERLTSAPVRAAFDLATSVMVDDTSDRPLGADLEQAVALLPSMATI